MNFVLACATCFGRTDELLAKGMNGGIFFLLGVLIVVLSFFLWAVFYLAKKDRAGLK